MGTLLVAGLLWELAVRLLDVPLFILPPPSAVGARMVEDFGLLLGHAATTAYETLIAFFLSVFVGIPLAIAIVSWRPFERAAYPLLVASQAIPKIALAPLFTIWFGFGLEPKIYIAFLIAFFPVVVSTVVGFRSISSDMIHLGRSMGMGPVRMFRRIRLPQALPSIFGGLEVAIALSLVGAIVGEFTGASSGLGFLLILTIGTLDIVLMFASVITAVILGITLFSVLIAVEHRVLAWHTAQRAGAGGTL